MVPEEHIEEDENGTRRIKQSFLKGTLFKHNVGLFQEDVREGRADPEWIRQAYVASESRHAGRFDSFLAKEAKRDWGIDIEALAAERKKGEEGAKARSSDEGDRMSVDEPDELSLPQNTTIGTPVKTDEAEAASVLSSPLSSPPSVISEFYT